MILASLSTYVQYVFYIHNSSVRIVNYIIFTIETACKTGFHELKNKKQKENEKSISYNIQKIKALFDYALDWIL